MHFWKSVAYLTWGSFLKGGFKGKFGFNDWKLIKYITAILPNLTGCDGSHGSGCCTSSTPCGENEGDCDGDSDCFGNLKCGDDNCNNSTFSWWEDCCYDPAKGEFPFPLIL